MRVDVQIATLARPGTEDEEVGEHLVKAVREALWRGGAPPSAVAVGREGVAAVPLVPFVQAGLAWPLVVVGLCRETPANVGAADAVGIIGVFQRRPPGDPTGVPVATVFLEWPDGRWWHWLGLLAPITVADEIRADRAGLALRPETQVIRRAIDGAPRPDGLGGWWTASRVRPIAMNWTSHEPPKPAEIVH